MVKQFKSWKDRLISKFPKFSWWQIFLLVAVGMILFSGFTIKSKWFSCQKEPIKIKDRK